ncbi:MAG: EAL domain-containing protein [Gallionella sp.]|nr:EAL domain-containing protein [Gallionella sp.]
MKLRRSIKAINSFFSLAQRKRYLLLAVIALLSIFTILGLVNIIQQVGKLGQAEQDYNSQLLWQREQSDDLAAIQIEFKNQVQEWKDVLLRGRDPVLYQQYWEQYEQSERKVRKELEELRDELLALENIERDQPITQLSNSAFPLTSREQLKKLQQRSLNEMHFVDRFNVLIEGHIQIGYIYRNFLARYPLSKSVNNTFVIDQGVRGIDRWMSEQLAVLHRESMDDQNKVIADAIARQQQDIHVLRLNIQRTSGAVIIIMLINLGLIIERLRRSEQEVENITKRSDATIYELAYSDALTGLPNRRRFLDQLDHAIALSRNLGSMGGLIFLDLDNFKTLNDTKGHALGDQLLVEVGHRIKACVRNSDVVARLGGDEFVVLLDALRGDAESANEMAGTIAEKICVALNQPYHLTSYTHHGGASLGVALFSRGDIDAEELLKRADTAMYQAKRAGRNTVRFYDQNTQNALEARSELEHHLYAALQDDQFELYYQIQVDQHRKAIGAEALLRWHHPELGLLHPSQFISLAEESDLILSIGNWVLNTACAQIKRWEASPLTRDLVLSINVSAAQLRKSKHVTKNGRNIASTASLYRPDFIEHLQQALNASGIDPSRLKLEITESMALLDMEHTISVLQQLKALGVSLSMDDFGTGHSSLTHLKRMPLDQIKIDQSFVKEIATDEYDMAIVRSMIDMAASMRINILAEGVENEAQEQVLLSQGCLSFQGHLYGKPVILVEFEQCVQRHTNNNA